MTCLCQHLPKGKICVQCAAERGLFPSFDADGCRKNVPRTYLAKCRVAGCDGSMVRDGMCLGHYTLWRNTGIEMRSA